MHGAKPTLSDIVLALEPPPEAVSLHCNEQLDSSEEEDGDDGLDYIVEGDEEDDEPTEPAGQAIYRVVTSCGECGRAVRLAVRSSEADIRALQDLLLGSLSIVCPVCA
ncbi:E7 [Macaca mulatta papillomavirus 3]|uniref:Protein E7 n=1 Tax=Macaca mulatta papillomavirus 3 TaxID=2294151 RepID=A0A385AHF8_9PAPI|nr:E7 [Macaca mulatta papillomavirus 3]AXN57288.1 E7 [Macaca mulatta papillomavirus 3]